MAQNLILSSAAADATVHPSGLCKTCVQQRVSAKRSTQQENFKSICTELRMDMMSSIQVIPVPGTEP